MWRCVPKVAVIIIAKIGGCGKKRQSKLINRLKRKIQLVKGNRIKTRMRSHFINKRAS